MVPTGIITKNSIETFFIEKDYTIPVSLYGVGDTLALWHVLESKNTFQTGPIWNISSGARTIYMLPKITDANGYLSLKKAYHLKNPPHSLNDHWKMFSYLANHPHFSEKWHSEIIFFSAPWFAKLQDKAFSKLLNYFLNQVWVSSSFRRNQFILDFAFSLAQRNKNLKPNPYLADTVRYLLAIGDGTVPGLSPAINNLSAPIQGLQKIFIEIYDIKKYAPIIIHPHHFSLKEKRTVYYSLEVPTTTCFSPRSSRVSSKMADMRELKDITEKFLAEIIKGSLRVEETPLSNLAEKIVYRFYHSDKDHLEEISPVSLLEMTDSAFVKTLIDNKNYLFPEFSPFFRGCISISGDLSC